MLRSDEYHRLGPRRVRSPHRTYEDTHEQAEKNQRHECTDYRDIRILRRHGARIYVGEFSAICWAEGVGSYIADCISLFEEYGRDWTYHAFREWAGWSVEHEGTCHADLHPSADNPRKRALLEGLNAK